MSSQKGDYVICGGPDKCAHPRILLWVFPAHRRILSVKECCRLRMSPMHIFNGPRHTKTCFRAYTDSEGSDQTARVRSLIRAFAVHCKNHSILQSMKWRAKGPDETFKDCK